MEVICAVCVSRLKSPTVYYMWYPVKVVYV